MTTFVDEYTFYSVLRVSFSTGFTFHYWRNETKQSKDQSKLMNQPRHNVKAKFETLKAEILESGFVTAERWKESVELKVQKYLKTRRVRQMMVSIGCASTGQLQEGSSVTKQHLAAIILYCDFSKLCTAFSATFRRLNVFESIESVIFRHSKFANFGRLLVEAVLDFGEKAGYRRGGELGPFFCGLSGNINIGSYAIRLEGPCSTTTQRTIALNFAKGDGVVLSLKNDSGEVREQTFLNCSWISNYHEEAERLWIAGTYPLRIVSIITVKTAKNYQKVRLTS